MDWIAIIPIAIALLLIGFFSGIEVVFISANKLSIELRKKQGNYSGKTWSFFLETPARFIITILIITNILLVIYALLASAQLISVWQYWSIENPYLILGAETIVATFILVFFQSIFKSILQGTGNSVTSGTFISFCIKIFFLKKAEKALFAMKHLVNETSNHSGIDLIWYLFVYE